VADELISNKIQLEGSIPVEFSGSGVSNAIAGLSQTVGRQIKITNLNIKKIMAKDIPDMFGGPKGLIVGVYVSITGYTGDHIMIVYQPDAAFDLIDMILGHPNGFAVQRAVLEQSILAKVSNMMALFFLNHLANTTGPSFHRSTLPAMMGVAGAILISDISDIMANHDYTYVVETTFSSCDRQLTGTFLVVPSLQVEFA